MSENRALAWWLLACCALVFAMVVLGGVTRLTGSGLSMSEWEPVSGILPPIGTEQWTHEFARYQRTPEYRYVNNWMSLNDFKRIYYYEWAHRLLGRTVGIVFLIPFLFFLATRRISRELGPRLIAVFVLGGLQGLLGWYMVKSGLVDNPHVSQYRLAAHLSLAVLIYGYMLWVALGLLRPAAGSSEPGPSKGAIRGVVVALLLTSVTLVSGAFVAGLRAGLSFNTFPTMAGYWLPPGMSSLQPWWRNLFENVTTVQFDHRVLALTTLICVLLVWVRVLQVHRHAAVRRCAHVVLAAVVVQVCLGVSTLLAHVPVSLAATHQAGAMVLISTLLVLAHEIMRLNGSSLKND